MRLINFSCQKRWFNGVHLAVIASPSLGDLAQRGSNVARACRSHSDHAFCLRQSTISAVNRGFLGAPLHVLSSFGGQRSIQLSYGCFGASFSRLAGGRQRPCGGSKLLLWGGARPEGQRSHVRIVSGAPGKHVPSVPGLWRVVLSRISRKMVHFARGEFPACK